MMFRNCQGICQLLRTNLSILFAAVSLFIISESSASATLMLFDFETEDDFSTPLVNGQSVSSPDEFGTIFLLTTTGDDHAGAAIFDSTFDVNDSDEDLQTGRGNILILQDSGHDDMNGDIFTDPNDTKEGGSIFFDFSPVGSVPLLNLILIDIDENATVDVILTDGAGRTRTYEVPNGWTVEADAETLYLGSNLLDLTTLADQSPEPGAFGGPATASQDAGFDIGDVELMEVAFSGSGGMDNLQIGTVPEPSALLLMGLATLFFGWRKSRTA